MADRYRLAFLLTFFISILPNEAKGKVDTVIVFDKQILADIREIKKQLPDFTRPDFKQIPYLIQRVNLELGITEYLLPPAEPGQPTAQIAFTRPSLDTHLSLLVFQTGLYKWRSAIPKKYVVLRRHSKKTPVYFLTFAYVQQNGMERVIEWEVEELSTSPPKSRIEEEICRGEECDLPKWILGTCPIVSHTCQIKLDKLENETIFKHSQFLKEQRDESLETLNFQNSKESDQEEEEEEDDLHRRRRRRSASKSHSRHSEKSREVHVPSSLDLLFIKDSEPSPKLPREKSSSLHGEQTSRSKRGKKARSVLSTSPGHNIEEIMHILKCRDCQKPGGFFEDLEEQVDLNRVLGEKLQIEFKNMSQKHWRRFPWTRRPSNYPYVGYGDCAYLSVDGDLNKPSSKEMDDVIDFYLDSLRLDCNNVLKNEIRGWLTSKWRFIRIVQDLSFELIPSSKLLTYAMLTPREFETLVSALLFLKYSTVYREGTLNQSGFRLKLLGHPLSARVSFLTRVFLKVIDGVNKHLKQHTIKITRSLARILKDKFYSLLLAKSFIRLKNASKQSHLHKENYRDRIQIMALKEFVLYGLNPIFRSGTPTQVAFTSFYQLNENRIRFLVHSYGFDTANN